MAEMEDEEFQFVEMDNKAEDEEIDDHDFDKLDNPLNTVTIDDDIKADKIENNKNNKNDNNNNIILETKNNNNNNNSLVVDNKKKNEKELYSLKSKFNDLIKKQEKEYSEIISLKKSLKKELSNVKKIKNNYETDYKEYNNLKTQLKKAKLDFEQEKTLFKSEKESLQDTLNKFNTNNNKLNKLIEKYENEYTKLKKLSNENNLNKKELNEFLKKGKEITNKMQLQYTKNSQLLNNNNNDKNDEYTKLNEQDSYCCQDCNTDIALHNDIESQCYQVGQGAFTEKKRGFLFKNAFNLKLGESKTENFTTGAYQISWVKCKKCNLELGWKYVNADNDQNKNKVGKYCLSRYKLKNFQDKKSSKK